MIILIKYQTIQVYQSVWKEICDLQIFFYILNSENILVKLPDMTEGIAVQII